MADPTYQGKTPCPNQPHPTLIRALHHPAAPIPNGTVPPKPSVPPMPSEVTNGVPVWGDVT